MDKVAVVCVCVCVCVMEYYLAIKKKEILYLCDNMDKPGGHYVKLDQSDTEKQILYKLAYTWHLKKSNHGSRHQSSGCQEPGGGGNGEMVAKGYKLSLIK